MTNLRLTVMIDGELEGHEIRDVIVTRLRGKDDGYTLTVALAKLAIEWPKRPINYEEPTQ